MGETNASNVLRFSYANAIHFLGKSIFFLIDVNWVAALLSVSKAVFYEIVDAY